MKIRGILFLSLALCLLISGCKSGPDNSEEVVLDELPSVKPTQEPASRSPNEEGTVPITEVTGGYTPNRVLDVMLPRTNDFAIDANGTFLALQDWEDVVDLEEILGNPTTEQTDVLTNADTLNGSRTKYITYDGLDIELFSPNQEEDRFWILSMKLSKNRYSTSRGISVGDSAADLKEAYPDIQLAPDGRTDKNNGGYLMSDEERYNRLWFEVAEGEISEIRIYHEIP